MTEVIPYQGYLKQIGELPKHITYKQYIKLRTEIIPEYYKNINMPNKRNEFLKERDTLLIDFCWASGGRIGDVTRILKSDIDFEEKKINFRVKKTRKTIKINLDRDLILQLSLFFGKQNLERPFNLTPTGAWYITKKFGRLINLDLHPHMFRHGLALHLLNNNIPIPIISYRLGHSNT